MKEDEIQNAVAFRGRLKDCVAHLFAEIKSRAPKGTREATAFRRPIAEFCGVKEDTVVRWMYDDGGPIGNVLFRLICYLRQIGYEVIEFDRADPVVRSTIELIGFRVMSGEEVAREIGYTTASSLFQVLGGRVGSSEEKKKALWNLAKKHRNALDELKSQAQRAIKSTQARQRTQEPKDSSAKRNTFGQHQGTQGIGHPPAGIGPAVTGIMRGLLILLEEGALTEDACATLPTEEQRMVLKLSGHLNRLSSSLVSREAE